MAGIEELAERVAEERRSWTGTRWRCSRPLRQEIVAAAGELVGTGTPVARVASAIGVTAPTLTRWLRSARAGKQTRQHGFRRVEVADVGGSSGLALVTPAGYRVEGLDLGGVERLLAALG